MGPLDRKVAAAAADDGGGAADLERKGDFVSFVYKVLHSAFRTLFVPYTTATSSFNTAACKCHDGRGGGDGGFQQISERITRPNIGGEMDFYCPSAVQRENLAGGN